ncbi:kinase-like domain-containing protein [Rhizoctonia solani]|nr:kinase-like domain-containing protein [Rhizoctonia solani]
MKRHFLTHRVGVLEKYRADAASQLSVTRLPGTLGSGETYRVPNSSYDPEAFPNGRLRNSATESIDPIEKPGFGGSDMVLLGADAERKGSETPTLERVPLVLPSESVEQGAREAEEKPPACLASLPAEPAQLLPINSGNNNKYYFYASGCFYYFDDHWRLYSDGGTLVYDGSSFQRDSHTTPTFNIDGLPCWFNLGGLFSRDADGAEYNVHTWQSNPETISHHMSMQEMFHHLLCHGCVNFSSQMDAQQENAMIVNGGGFGDIWLGRLSDGTQVAIKAWRASVIEQCDYKTLKRATREIYYWSKLKHENIHQLMGVIMFKGQYLGMVSQWMENGNLCGYMRKNPNFDRCKMSVRVASGLVYMHHRNAVHGDLRASNILVSSDGDPKLTDFGLSTMSEAGLAFSETTNVHAGSMRWASPEQLLEGSPSSKPSDVYALGMTILEIFTGEVPYYPQCRKDFQVMSKLQQGVLPTRPTEQLKDDAYGNRIWELLVKCWNREPDNRPTAMEVFESLNAIYPAQHV